VLQSPNSHMLNAVVRGLLRRGEMSRAAASSPKLMRRTSLLKLQLLRRLYQLSRRDIIRNIWSHSLRSIIFFLKLATDEPFSSNRFVSRKLCHNRFLHAFSCQQKPTVNYVFCDINNDFPRRLFL
jgi:hypothetical protein